MKVPSFMFSAAAAAALLTVNVTPSEAQTVKITGTGNHDGEFCRRDRAMLFEDPDGTRFLGAQILDPIKQGRVATNPPVFHRTKSLYPGNEGWIAEARIIRAPSRQASNRSACRPRFGPHRFFQ